MSITSECLLRAMNDMTHMKQSRKRAMFENYDMGARGKTLSWWLSHLTYILPHLENQGTTNTSNKWYD